MAGRNAAALIRGDQPGVPPRTTALGALSYYVSHADPHNYQPTNITFGIIAAAPGGSRRARDRKMAISERALRALEEWIQDAACGRIA
jgi:methylenetetrahydrofolate--tRNA-(uracil-5-)-methyltransferase